VGEVPEAMMLIAHRGNTCGPITDLENTPEYIDRAIKLGYYVEVDVWGLGQTLWLGHDAPNTPVEHKFFREREGELFCHCKNADAIRLLHDHVEWPCYFFHSTDDYTITSNGFVWCFPGRTPPHKDSIVVLPEKFWPDNTELWASEAAGVCSDYISRLKKA
jgi:hypothetical protein